MFLFQLWSYNPKTSSCAGIDWSFLLCSFCSLCQLELWWGRSWWKVVMLKTKMTTTDTYSYISISYGVISIHETWLEDEGFDSYWNLCRIIVLADTAHQMLTDTWWNRKFCLNGLNYLQTYCLLCILCRKKMRILPWRSILRYIHIHLHINGRISE